MTIINETERLVIEFASVVGQRNLYPITNESQVWLVREQHTFDKPAAWRMLNHGIAWSYTLIGGICQKEAIEAEFGERLSNGKHVKAEAYIGLWREAILQSISINALASCSMSLLCTISNSTQYLLTHEGDYKASADAALQSTYLTHRDDTQCTWVITLDCLEACEAHYQLTKLRSYDKKYNGLYSETLQLQILGNEAPVAEKSDFDLFRSLEVAA